MSANRGQGRPAGEFRYVGPVWLLAILYGISLIAFSSLPAVHRLRCPYHPGNPVHVLESAAAVLRDDLNIPCNARRIDDNHGTDQELKILTTLYRLENPDNLYATYPVKPVYRPRLKDLTLRWYQPEQTLSLVWGFRLLKPFEIADSTNADTTASPTTAWLRYVGSRQSDENLAGMSVILRDIARAVDSTHADSLGGQWTERLAVEANYHLRHIRQEDRLYLVRMASSIILIVATSWWSGPIIVGRYRRARELRRRYRKTGLWVPRPFFLACFVARDTASFLTTYQSRLDRHVAKLRRAARAAGEQQRADVSRQATVVMFDESVSAFRQSLTEPEQADPSIQAELDRAADNRLSLSARSSALAAAHGWLVSRRRPRDERLEQPSYEQRLLSRVRSVDIESLPPDQRTSFIRCLREYEDVCQQEPQREKKRVTPLERALAAAQSTEPAVTNGTRPIVVESPAAPANGITVTEDFFTLLNLDPLLPPEVDGLHTAAIIIWGLLKVTQRGRAAFDQRYRTAQYVREDVASKLGEQFDPEQYDRALDWLMANRVLIDPKTGRHQPMLSINPHASKATIAGEPVVERIVGFYAMIQRTLHV